MEKTFKSRHNREGMLLQLRTRYLHVGRCDNRFPGTARFFPTEVVYAFDHPVHRKVEMHMKYADMLHPRTSDGARRDSLSFRFRIGSRLEYFSRDYDPDNPAHSLRLELHSDTDMRRFLQLVYPVIRTAARDQDSKKPSLHA